MVPEQDTAEYLPNAEPAPEKKPRRADGLAGELGEGQILAIRQAAGKWLAHITDGRGGIKKVYESNQKPTL